MPRIILKRRPSSRNDSPGLSSVPASMDPIITLDAPAASAFTMSPEYLMPPSAMTGTSPAPSTASNTAVSCGTPTPVTTRVVQIEPGPTPTFTASTPRSTSAALPRASPRCRRSSCTSGNASRTRAVASSTPSLWPCAVSITSTSTPASTSARARSRKSPPRRSPPRRAAGHAGPCSPSGYWRRLWMSLTVISPRSIPSASTTGSFSIAMLAEDPLGLVERRADGRGDEAVRRHRLAKRAVEVALELQVAIGDDPDELACLDRRSARRRC